MPILSNKFAIVIGHTEKHPGAMGAAPINEHEFHYNQRVASVIYRYARTFQIDSKVFTKLSDVPDPTEEVYKRVDEWCGDANAVCIELHFNAADQKSEGTLTLFDEHPEDSLDFAREVHQAGVTIFKRKDKADRKCMLAGDKYNRGVKNLTAMRVTGCIVEPFFGDNPKDAALGYERMFEYAQEVALAAERFLKKRMKDF